MSNENNKKNNGDRTTDRLEKEDGYKFIKETIKERPINKRLLVMRIAGIMGAGVLFGATAAVTCAGVLPVAESYWSDSEETPKVNIPYDELEPTAAAEETENPQSGQDPEETPAVTATPTETPTPEVTAAPEENVGLADYEDIYQEALQISEEPRKALVTVSGVSDQETILGNTFLSSGQAAGIIFTDNGNDLYILTEKQATDNASKIQVTLSDGSIVEGRLQKSDSRTGLAVVLISKEEVGEESLENISVAVLGNSYSLMQGKPVIAIGSPSGYHDSVSYGIITSVGNKVAVTDAEYNLLTTDILGSSKGSGVLLDINGEVIGIIAQSYGNQDDESKNMVKALAVSQLKPLIEGLSNGEDIRYLGIKGQDVTEAISQNTGIPQGVYVDEVEEDSPAMLSGVQRGDVIVKMDQEEITTMQKYSSQLQKYSEGQDVTLTVMRSRGEEGYSSVEIGLTVRVN